VGWSIDSGMKARLVVAAIEMAVARRGELAGCSLHSDRRSQSRAREGAGPDASPLGATLAA
jgi:putative transposase